MGSATREHRLAALAALLGVGSAMCNREQEAPAWPVQAREVPSAAPDPTPSSVAVTDAAIQEPESDASVAMVDAGAAANAAFADAAISQPPPHAPSVPIALAAFERRPLPPPRPAGARPPTPPPQRCCSTNPSCGARSCSGIDLSQPAAPYLRSLVQFGLRAKADGDAATLARANRWLAVARGAISPCLGPGLGMEPKGATLNVEVHAADGGAGVAFALVSSTAQPAVGACVVTRMNALASTLVIDGAPAKVVFPIVVSTEWVVPNVGPMGTGGP